MSLFVHVGANALPEAQALAAGAAAVGADAIALMPPVFYRPESEEALVDWCAAVAGAADGLPLSYYESPEMSGVELSMPRFIELARDAGIHYRGLKFTDSNIELFRELCGARQDGEQMWWGRDEELRSGLGAGATGAIGSTYNFAAGVYRPVLEESKGSDSALAVQAQADAVRLIEILAGYGYLPAAKAVMDMLGVPVGPARAPLTRIGSEEISALRRDLEQLGFFDWIRDS